MYNSVELFKKPREIFEKIGENKAEMSELEHGFLCGLLKQYKPKKILEVGVAAGGTTVVTLNCLQEMNHISEVHSIDLEERYYRDRTKNVGWQIEYAKPYLQNMECHTLHLGNIAPAFLEEIGGDIDFLILDTVHSLPGELLDFIACLPYLAPGAIVVLHDISLNHYGTSKDSFATKVLFDTVVADKILCFEEGYPNIGAFQITSDTQKYIRDCFSALTISWLYVPAESEIDQYRKFYQKHYTQEYIRLFEYAVEHNLNLQKKEEEKEKKEEQDIRLFQDIWKQNKKIMFYGTGTRGNYFYKFIKDRGLDIDSFLCSDDSNSEEYTHFGKKVYRVSEIPYLPEEYMIILTTTFEVVQNTLEEKGISFIKPTNELCEFIKKYNAIFLS